MSQSAPPIPDSHALLKQLSHPCFPQQRDANVKVWRYMDLAKLISLIQSRRLYLARLDQLADPFAPGYYFEAVKAVLSSMAPNLVSRLAWSQMKLAPVF